MELPACLQARQELEKIKRRLESEIADFKEQLGEKRQQVEELVTQLARREEEMQNTLQRYVQNKLIHHNTNNSNHIGIHA